ncbi:hypothetical protein D3C76_1291330 [compost metagenome]
MKDADNISQPAKSQRIAYFLVAAAVNVTGHLGVEADGQRGQCAATCNGDQVGRCRTAVKQYLQRGPSAARDAEAPGGVIARAGREYGQRNAGVPHRRQQAVDRAVAADNSHGLPSLLAGQSVLKKCMRLLSAVRKGMLVRNAPPAQLLADFVPNPAAFAIPGIWIHDKQIHDDSPIYVGSAKRRNFSLLKF